MTVRPDDTAAAPDAVLDFVGRVASSLASVDAAPRQADEGAPPARIVLSPDHRPALGGVGAGDAVVVLTWLHLADRTVLATRPRDDPDRPVVGVFATRSPDRPNPVGLHEVTVVSVEDDGFTVDHLDVVDGTPVIDVKPVLAPRVGER